MVAHHVDEWGIDALFPITEKSLKAILPRRDELGGVKLPFPDASVFETVSDKARVLEAAAAIGLSVPRQWVWEKPEDVDLAEVPEGSYPLVIKPTRSVAELGNPVQSVGLCYIDSVGEMKDWVAGAGPGDFPALVQERVFGDGAGVFVMTWDGELKAAVGHRRIREKPPSGGVSVLRESTEVNPELLDRSLRLLSQLGWVSGVAMVEYKLAEPTGAPVLMEINGRFWGSLQLAIDAGVDFPNLLLQAAGGRIPDPPVMGRPGVKSRWLLGDLDQLAVRLVKKRSDLRLPPGSPGRLKACMEFLADFRPGVRTEVMRMSDPRPFIGEVGAWLNALR
ncbi:MAG: ATP-grasp domain-containing protein [Gemmatimonadota bacterium]